MSLHLKYIEEKENYVVEYSMISPHVIQITGDFPIKCNGFTLSRFGNGVDYDDAWDYTEFTTIYRELDGGVQFSDDGSVYVAPPEPERVPDTEPYVPTLDDVKAAKKQEVYSMYQVITAAGMDVELSTGVEHFPLSEEDRSFLMGKQIELAAGATEVSYQDSNNHCMLLSSEDMQKIITAALTFINVQTTYRNNLCEWIDMCDKKEDVENIVYGAEIPSEYQNEVYKMYLEKGVN